MRHHHQPTKTVYFFSGLVAVFVGIALVFSVRLGFANLAPVALKAWRQVASVGPLHYQSAWFAKNNLALSFAETITPADLKTRYQQGKLRVLIVPGHDNKYSGTEYRGVKEADLTLILASNLAQVLALDKHLSVTVSRDLATGDYFSPIADYLKANQAAIVGFRSYRQLAMAKFIDSGLIDKRGVDFHNNVKDEVSYRLYGVNKWADENNFDITIHVHFNDHPRKKTSQPGEHKGLAVYVPEDQYPNARASRELGQEVFTRLNTILATSTMPYELAGVVPDQGLIAVGSNASRTGAALLIEYGYIYESNIFEANKRVALFPQLAALTYQGLADYLK